MRIVCAIVIPDGGFGGVPEPAIPDENLEKPENPDENLEKPENPQI